MITNLTQKIVVIIGLILSIAFVTSFSYAASSVTIAAGSTSLTVGSSTNLTIRANNVTGRINITSSNPNVISLSSSNEWVENGSVTIRATAKAVGSAYITVTSADTSDSTTGDSVSVSTGVNLTSKEIVVDTRSANNYLSSLTVEGYELSPAFNTNTNNYTINVKSDISSINISAIPADNKARTVVDGNLDLVSGENNVTITVTAENGYKRVYTLTVVKEKNPDDIDATIESLVINNAKLKNEFKSDVFEYMCDDITADIEKLDIVIKTKIPDLKYEIVGNEDLKQGINHIVIKVTSRDGSVTKEYEIIVFKTDEVLALKNIDEVEGEIGNKSWLDELREYKYEIMLGIGSVVAIVIVIVLIITIRRNKNEVGEEEYKTSNENTFEEKIQIEENEENKSEELDQIEENFEEKNDEIEDIEEILNIEKNEHTLDDKSLDEVSDEIELMVNDSDEVKENDVESEVEHKVRKGNLTLNTNEDKSKKGKKIEEKVNESKIKLDLSKLSDKE